MFSFMDHHRLVSHWYCMDENHFQVVHRDQTETETAENGHQSFDTSSLSYDQNTVKILGAISLNILGGKLAPKLVYFVLRKELLKC